VIFRTIGWRELGKTDRLARGVAFAVGVLGALTYLLIIGALIIGGDQGGPKLAYAAVPRTVYSVEAAPYLRLGRLSSIRTFYIAMVNIPAVLYFAAVANGMAGGAKLSEGPPGIFFVMDGFLVFSRLMAGISFHLYRPRSRILGTPSAPYAPITTRTQAGGSLQMRGETLRETGAVTTRPASPVQQVRVEVVAIGTSIVCVRYGKESPLTSSSCPSCGAAFQKVSYGPRCPACSASLKIAKRISEDRFVCTQCFSDLRVSLAS